MLLIILCFIDVVFVFCLVFKDRFLSVFPDCLYIITQVNLIVNYFLKFFLSFFKNSLIVKFYKLSSVKTIVKGP